MRRQMNTQLTADDILAGTEKIIAAERLTRGRYIRMGVPQPEAPCGGHSFCLIGALLWAGEFRPEGINSADVVIREEAEYEFDTSAGPTARFGVIEERPALQEAYDVLEEAAVARVRREHGLDDLRRLRSSWGCVAEGYLESLDATDEDMRTLIADARARLATTTGGAA